MQQRGKSFDWFQFHQNAISKAYWNVIWQGCLQGFDNIPNTLSPNHFNMVSNQKESTVELRTFELCDEGAVLVINELIDEDWKLDSSDYESGCLETIIRTNLRYIHVILLSLSSLPMFSYKKRFWETKFSEHRMMEKSSTGKTLPGIPDAIPCFIWSMQLFIETLLLGNFK